MIVLEAALFNREPEIGSTDVSGEIHYTGYRRVPFLSDRTTNLTEIVFPESEQDEPVWAGWVVAINCTGIIVGCELVESPPRAGFLVPVLIDLLPGLKTEDSSVEGMKPHTENTECSLISPMQTASVAQPTGDRSAKTECF